MLFHKSILPFQTTLFIFITLLGACSKDSSHIEKKAKLAGEKYQAQDLGAAAALYREILEEDGDRYAERIMLGKILFFQRKFPEAVEQFQKATDINAGRIEGFIWWAKTLSYTPTGTEEALITINKALSIDPSNIEANYLRGRILEQKGDLPAAMAAYEASLLYTKPAALAAVRIALIQKEAGLKDQADRSFERARQFARGDNALLQEIDGLVKPK